MVVHAIIPSTLGAVAGRSLWLTQPGPQSRLSSRPGTIVHTSKPNTCEDNVRGSGPDQFGVA